MAKSKKVEKPNPPENVAVIYARYSTDNQKESSIDAQVRACHEYAKRNDLQVIREYKDEAKSGTDSTKRVKFREMLADSKDCEFSKVIVFSIDRFSRNLRNYLNDVYDLEQNGVSLRSATEQVDDSFSGKTLAVVLMLSAELYVESVVKHVKKSQYETARQGLYVGGAIPLGYSIDSNNEYQINEKEAEIVRQIFEMYVAGKAYDEITDHLNFKGDRTKAKNEFGKHSLYGILHNEKYIGTYRYGDNEDTELAYEPIFLPNRLPKIVTKDLFDKAQAKLIERKRDAGRSRASRNYCLSGMIHCGLCKSNMHINSSGKGKSYITYYKCPKSKKKGFEERECTNHRSIKRVHAEKYVLGKLFSQSFALTSLSELTAKFNEYIKLKSQESPLLVDDKKKELALIERRLQNLKDSIASGSDSPMIQEELKRYEGRLKVVTEEMEQLQRREETGTLSQNGVFQLIKKVKKTLKYDGVPECRNFMEAYIEDILITSEKIRVKLKTPQLQVDTETREGEV